MEKAQFLAHLAQNPDAIATQYFDDSGTARVGVKRNPQSFEPWIQAHLDGHERIGLYNAVYSEVDDSAWSRWGCIDFDGPSHKTGLPNAMELAMASYEAMCADGLDPWFEVSHAGDGYHLWVLFDDLVPVNVLQPLLRRYTHDNPQIEVFPKNTTRPGKSLGNFVWAPFWGASDFCDMWFSGRVIFVEDYQGFPDPDSCGHSGGTSASGGEGGQGQRFTATDLMPKRPRPPMWVVEEALTFIASDDYHDWIKMLAVIYKEYGPGADEDDPSKGEAGKEMARAWSQKSVKYDDYAFEQKWESFADTDIRATVGSIVWRATCDGWDRKAWNLWASQVDPSELEGQVDGEVLPEADSDVSLARHLIGELSDYGNRDVFGAEGRIWIYEPLRGVWEALPNQTLNDLIMGYNGQWTAPTMNAKGELKRKKIGLNAFKVRGIREMVFMSLGAEDSWPDAAAGVAFRNGFLSAKGLIEHSPEHFARMFVDVDFDEKAHHRASMWQDFLARCFGNQPEALAKAEIAALQEFAGAALMGVAPQYSKVFLLYGPGGTGKSTFIKTIRAMFSKEELGQVKPQELSDEKERVNLVGVRLNALEEMPAWKFGDAADFKEIVEGAPFKARYRYGQPFQVNSQAAFLISSNNLPDTNDVSSGFWRRWRIIEFGNVLPEGERKLGLGDMFASRARSESWLFSWAYEGYLRLLKQGRYTEGEGSNGIINEWQALTDPVLAFVQEKVRMVGDGDAAWFVSSEAVFGEFKRWAAGNNIKVSQMPTGRRGLVIALRQLGLRYERRNNVRGFNIEIQK